MVGDGDREVAADRYGLRASVDTNGEVEMTIAVVRAVPAGAHVLGQLLHDLRTEFEVPEVAAVGFAGGLRAQPDRSGATTFLREKRPLLMMMYLREL